MLALRLPEDIERRLEALAKRSGRSKSFYAREAILEHLDDLEYHKADPSCYFKLAAAVDGSSVNQISLEDAHHHNDLALLEEFVQSTVIFGAVAIAQSKVESVDDIASRLTNALKHIDRERLIAAPDCGLAMLGRDLAMIKLSHLCKAASEV